MNYIDKTFPITLQDLIDLAKSENLDPRDLKLITNETNNQYSKYAQCAVLKKENSSEVSIQLYVRTQNNPTPNKPHNPLKDNITIDTVTIKDL